MKTFRVESIKITCQKVGKRVELKIWRGQRLISKKVVLGRLESSQEYIAENKTQAEEGVTIESLKIIVRDLRDNDISERKLPKNTSGVVVTKILDGSPLRFLSINDIIVELQKKKVINANQFSKLIKDILSSGEKTLMFATYNSNNQRGYLTVKLE